MTDRSILFSAPMVRALLAGRKTQTRRVLNPQPGTDGIFASLGQARQALRITPGDRLWVREAWRAEPTHDDLRPSDLRAGWPVLYEADAPHSLTGGRLRPGIHMPRWASRLTLAVSEVRVERLQDIREADAIAEGATSRPHCSGFQNASSGWSMDWSRVSQPSRFGSGQDRSLTEADISLCSPVAAFAGFINGLHDPKWNHRGDGIFGANPWVAAISFTVERRNIDAAPEVRS